MRYQKTCYSCGAAAVVNALKCFGRNVAERIVRPLAGTTEEDGTGEDGIVEALGSLGYSSKIFSSDKKKESLSNLRKELDEGNPVIIVVDKDTHWVTVVGRIGKKFLIFDSTRTQVNIKENGIVILGEREIFNRWTQGEQGFFGIVVKKKK